MSEILLGYCGVDSGQIMLVDPCYVTDRKDQPNPFPEGDMDFGDNLGRGPYSKHSENEDFTYTGACRTTLGGGGGELGRGVAVVTATAYGDGQYPVYAEVDSAGKVVSVRIDFQEQEEPTCSWCGSEDVDVEGAICYDCEAAEEEDEYEED